MESRLAQLLYSLDPQETINRLGLLVDEAVNSFELSSSRIESGTEFRELLVRFYRHIHGSLLGIPHHAWGKGDDQEWWQCHRMLNAIYGNQHGCRTAQDIARHGVEGGLYGVLKQFAKHALDQRIQELAKAGIQSLWHALSTAERLEIIEEYRTQHASMLPPEIMDLPAAVLHEDFPRLLEHHPELVARFRRIGRSSG
jgi:hypothetical protein